MDAFVRMLSFLVLGLKTLCSELSVPEDVAEEQSCVVPEGPVVVEWVDGGGQRLQDAVHNAGHQTADVGAQVQIRILDQALHHVEQPVQLLQVVAHRFHLKTKRSQNNYLCSVFSLIFFMNSGP